MSSSSALKLENTLTKPWHDNYSLYKIHQSKIVISSSILDFSSSLCEETDMLFYVIISQTIQKFKQRFLILYKMSLIFFDQQYEKLCLFCVPFSQAVRIIDTHSHTHPTHMIYFILVAYHNNPAVTADNTL